MTMWCNITSSGSLYRYGFFSNSISYNNIEFVRLIGTPVLTSGSYWSSPNKNKNKNKNC